jgi:hypothetical protein
VCYARSTTDEVHIHDISTRLLRGSTEEFCPFSRICCNDNTSCRIYNLSKQMPGHNLNRTITATFNIFFYHSLMPYHFTLYILHSQQFNSIYFLRNIFLIYNLSPTDHLVQLPITGQHNTFYITGNKCLTKLDTVIRSM